MHLPVWAPVPNGSVVVFAIANPVSNPWMFVTYGYNRIVRHILMLNRFLAAFGSAMNRGIGSELEAAAPLLALNAGGEGAKLKFTVAVPGAGVFCATLDTKVSYTPNFRVSLAFGLVLITSQTAVAVPLTTLISVSGMLPPWMLSVELSA